MWEAEWPPVLKRRNKELLGLLVAVIVIAVATAVLKILGHTNPTTVALALLLIVLFVATAWGPKPAVIASLLGVTCINYFFIPPVGSFHINDPENWIALLAFLITAMTVGQLSARAKRRAEEANAARQEVERLYRELQDSFEQASQAKALKHSERLKSALLDAVTHDLRTPLTSIKASVTTLLEDQPSNESGEEKFSLGQEGWQEMLEVIDEEADRLDRFIEGMMDLARIEAGELKLRRRLGSLAEIASEAMKRAEPRTREHRLEFRFGQELPAVNVDEAAFVEVIYILLENAAKYSPKGSTITIAGSCDQSEVRLSVEDQGPGIESGLRERVFDKFFRGVPDGDDKPSGTGMGLAIAQGIVEAHGGRIWNESASETGGSRFIVALPSESSNQAASGDGLG